MANHIAGSGDPNFFQFILSELIIKCATRFGRLVKILEAQWKDYKKIIFSMLISKIRLCVDLNFFSPKPMGLLDLVA
jgi:hypothetical protein